LAVERQRDQLVAELRRFISKSTFFGTINVSQQNIGSNKDIFYLFELLANDGFPVQVFKPGKASTESSTKVEMETIPPVLKLDMAENNFSLRNVKGLTEMLKVSCGCRTRQQLVMFLLCSHAGQCGADRTQPQWELPWPRK
jgi:hypothetical protein